MEGARVIVYGVDPGLTGPLYAPPEQSPAVKAMLAKVIRRKGPA